MTHLQLAFAYRQLKLYHSLLWFVVDRALLNAFV